jgi:hypothetical protein
MYESLMRAGKSHGAKCKATSREGVMEVVISSKTVSRKPSAAQEDPRDSVDWDLDRESHADPAEAPKKSCYEELTTPSTSLSTSFVIVMKILVIELVSHNFYNLAQLSVNDL